MSTVKRSQIAQRDALTQAIESKVHRLDMAALVKLAVELKVPVPTGVKAARAGTRPHAPRRRVRDEKILVGSGVGPVVSASEGSRILDAMTVDDSSADWAESELVGAGELVRRLEISRGTLDNWRKAQKIVAFRKGLRNYIYPVRQFERLKPVEGLDRIAPLFSSSEEAWEWLVAPNRMTDGKPPIETLREGKVALVISAAEGALDYA
ncbi:antitoxin Xre/MbcA/ParS-like domain-containing protein [Inquilinus sp. CA228]|uniref:antitoxin Xre/MbcA/ParS-like domain-containing protein n=1 Tax=Inquilinus sp. CA228 TaxID=3455609 RepID=UPI003F8D490B